jgi:Mn2+/Fe2+ NRAMP family transporter
MIAKRVMKKEEARFLFIFKYFKYFPYETRKRSELIKNIRDKVLRNQDVEKDILFLIALVGATFMERRFFERSERKIARKRIKEISSENGMATIANETMKAVKSAIVASIVAATVATSAASSASSH